MATDWLKLAQDAYEASTSYIDTNLRSKWDAQLRAFNNEHPNGSKYHSDAYKNRSRLFRPRIRTIVRKNEAAAAAALFSNSDVLAVEPSNPDDPVQAASAKLTKELVQYRLTKTIPWFQLCIGGFQDAQTIGVVCSYQYWDYKEKQGVLIEDKPCIELVPVENLRIDPASDWIDPVGSSPYLIHKIPMYAGDVMRMMTVKDPKTGSPKWKRYKVDELRRAAEEQDDSTRMSRIGRAQDPTMDAKPFGEFDIIWIHRNFMRAGDEEMVYYTVGTQLMLTTPMPLQQAYFHGKRPYAIGVSVIETHKPMPNGIAGLGMPYQTEANEIANQRSDNVKLVLNKKHFVTRGRQVDVEALVRNVPGGVVMMNDVERDVKEMSYPDVTSSAYQEQNFLNADMDDLLGNFSGSSVQTNRALNETVGGMRMMNAGASMMTEYTIRTVVETWVEKVIRQLILLEQYYETDETILAICGNKAQLFQQFGINQITDTLLKQELTCNVNVGLGATNPDQRMQKLMMATKAAIEVIGSPVQGLNAPEVVKELYGIAGFRDGERFFQSKGGDPRLQQAMQMIQQLQATIQNKVVEQKAAMQVDAAKIQSEERVKMTEIQVNRERIMGDLQIRASEIQVKQGELAVEQARLELDRQKAALEAQNATQEGQAAVAKAMADIEEKARRLELEARRLDQEAARIAVEKERADKEHAVKVGQLALDERGQNSAEVEIEKKYKPAEDQSSMMKSLMATIENVMSQLEATRGDVSIEELRDEDGNLVGAVANYPDGKKRTISRSMIGNGGNA